jgi:hypothetical protein
MIGKLADVQRFLEPAVSPANHIHSFPLIKWCITCRAKMNIHADQPRFTGDAQAAVGAARGDQDSASAVFMTIGGPHQPVRAIVIQPGDVLRLQNFHAKTLRLMAQSIREFGPIDALIEAGEIIHEDRHTDLSPHPAPLDHQRRKSFAAGINSGGQSSRAAANDDHVVKLPVGFHVQPHFFGKLRVGGFHQDRAIGENNRGNTAHPIVDPFDFLQRFRMQLHVDVVVMNPLLTQKGFGAAAVGAPIRAKHADSLISIGSGHDPAPHIFLNTLLPK